MIFFTEKIKPFYEKGNPHIVSPIGEVTLKDNRIGYVLGDDKKASIEAKGVSVEIISKDDIKIDEI